MREKCMFTVSDIITDITCGCAIHNLNENCFSYRIVYFVNEENKSIKRYLDTSYSRLRQSLENVIRGNLNTTNTLVIAQTTVRKNGKGICLLSRPYSFSLDGYFRQIYGKYQTDNRNERVTYGRYSTRSYKPIYF